MLVLDPVKTPIMLNFSYSRGYTPYFEFDGMEFIGREFGSALYT